MSDSVSSAGATGTPIAMVFGKEGAANVVIHNFATDVTPATGIRPSTDVTFTQVCAKAMLLIMRESRSV